MSFHPLPARRNYRGAGRRRRRIPMALRGLRLVSPQRTVHCVANEDDVGSLVATLGLETKMGYALKGNLLQLCGWRMVGADRDGRSETNNWQLLEGIKWLKRVDSAEVVPVVGKTDHIYQTFSPSIRSLSAAAGVVQGMR